MYRVCLYVGIEQQGRCFSSLDVSNLAVKTCPVANARPSALIDDKCKFKSSLTPISQLQVIRLRGDKHASTVGLVKLNDTTAECKFLLVRLEMQAQVLSVLSRMCWMFPGLTVLYSSLITLTFV